MSGLSSLRPAAELARGHGTRLQYHAGCKCYYCRMANSDYERQRMAARKAGDWNGPVDASKARKHLLALRKKGVGRDAVHAASGVAATTIRDIASGVKKRIRARTERRLLAVTTDCREDGARVSAAQTWRLIAQLLEEGFTKQRLAEELGFKTRKLQFSKKQITVRNAARVERLFNKYMR